MIGLGGGPDGPARTVHYNVAIGPIVAGMGIVVIIPNENSITAIGLISDYIVFYNTIACTVDLDAFRTCRVPPGCQ